jgi:hypothetical protein
MITVTQHTPEQTAVRFPATFGAARCVDFVSSDAAALASHMNECASTRSRFFELQTALETAHSLISARLVTAGAVALVLAALASLA